ncbi:MAG: Ig domain-containing protein [Clostridia bacterium]|nr:Ig domain-containing protein [Clostridia bacterium]
MKKILVPLLVLAMLMISMAALAEGNEAITVELNTARLPVYEADDPTVDLFRAEGAEENTLPVLLVPLKKNLELRVTVMPKDLKNRKSVLTTDDEEVARIRETTLYTRNAGETILTIASAMDPAAANQYRVIVYQPVTRIAVNASEKAVAVGETIRLTADILPENAAMKDVEWSSQDEKTATVDGEGNVTGVKRGTARITATAKDGSNIKASISIQVNQNPEEITLDKPEVTVDTGRSTAIRATVLPKDANNKNVVWASSDESIARVNADGRVTGVALGECTIICTDKQTGTVQASAVVHVQQPVTKVTLGEAPAVYAGETAQLTWTTEPANASNPAVTFRSGNTKVLTVSEDGTVTGVKAGETWVTVMSTDGSNRQAKVKVKVYQHVTGVHMKRNTAYIDLRTKSTTTAVLEPETATNHNMTWVSADPSIATVEPIRNQPQRISIYGVSEGFTVITGTTEDGGFQTSIPVLVGHWEKSLKIQEAKVKGADAVLKVKNVSDLTITSIKVEVSVFDNEGKPVPCNSKDDSNTYVMTYKKTLEPGDTTKEKDWKTVNFKLPDSPTVHEYVVKITEFEIDHDWIKVIRKNNQPTQKCPVHL